MTNNLPTGLPLYANACAVLAGLGWQLSPCIYGGTTAIHSGQGRRLDARTVADLIELADEETAKAKTAAAACGQ